MENVVKVTKMEMKVLTAIADADHSSDGHGLCGWLQNDEWDMKKYRGVIASLVKKGIVTSDAEDDMVWLAISNKYQVENEKNDWSGYDLANVEV